MICGNPLWLASALRKIDSSHAGIRTTTRSLSRPQRTWAYADPLNGHGVDNLFSTHPNVENRIAALQEFAREMGVTGSADLGTSGSAADGGGRSGEVWIGGRNYTKPPSPWG